MAEILVICSDCKRHLEHDIEIFKGDVSISVGICDACLISKKDESYEEGENDGQIKGYEEGLNDGTKSVEAD